jgi:formyl-CoA transferase
MTETPTWPGPLSGIRVLDFTRVLAGPAASLALADLGAEVIKIEPPGSGDDTRTFPPTRDGESHYYLAINRGKKSIVIDLKDPAGLQLAKDLAAKCDILIENYRPGVMDRLGLGYEALREINPGLIYCAISGYGMTGPMKDLPSFDIVLQAQSGALYMNAEPGGQPMKLGLPMGDLVGGISGPIGILAALFERTRTGKGRLIDVSLTEGLIGLSAYLPQLAWFTGGDPQPQGSQHPNLVPYGVFPASDGSMVIACLTNGFWVKICAALGMNDWAQDPRFTSLEGRRDARAEINARISAATELQTMQALQELFTAHGVPHAPILSVLEALNSPQSQARGVVVAAEHKTLGKIPLVNRPIRFVPDENGSDQAPVTAPPTLGENTDEILGEILGLDELSIAALRKAGTVA